MTPLEQRLNSLETAYSTRIIVLEEAIKKIPPQRVDNHGSEITKLKSEIENLKLLTSPLADIDARLKKLEDSHSAPKLAINMSSPPAQSNWFKKNFRKR